MKSPRSLTTAFASGMPAATQRAQGNATALSALSVIDRRAAKTRERVLSHYANFEDRWVAKEIVRLLTQHTAESARHPAPPGVDRTPSPQSFARTAAHNVKARVNKRLSLVSAIKTRMSNAVVRNLEPQPLKQTFGDVASETQKRHNRRTI